MMGSKTKQLEGTGRYVDPDTSNELYQQLQTGGRYDPMQWINQGMGSYMQGIGTTADLYGQGISALQGGIGSQIPGLQDMARTTAEGATSQYGVSARQLAQEQARAAQESVASEYAGSGALNSGAAMRSIAGGTATPLLQAETDINNAYSNIYGGTANSLYNNAYQNLGQQGQLYGQQAGQVGSLYGGLGAQQYGYGGQLMGLLGQAGQSLYIAPQYQQGKGAGSVIGGGLMGGLSGAAAGATVGGPVGAAIGGGVGLLGGLFS